MSRDKAKVGDILNSLGFNADKIQAPTSVSLSRFSFEIFLQNAVPIDFRLTLTSDHIEHGFRIIASDVQDKETVEVQNLINHVFVFSYYEILSTDTHERATEFLNREQKLAFISEADLQSLSSIQSVNDTDTCPVIFSNILKPINQSFSAKFYNSIEQILNETSTPVISYLLRPFLRREPEPFYRVSPYSQVSNRFINLWGQQDSRPQNFLETALPKLNYRQNPYVEYRLIRDCPVLAISQPKFIPPQLPSVSLLKCPQEAEYVAADLSSTSFVYSIDTAIFYSSLTNQPRVLQAHTSSVATLSISNDGKFVLSGDLLGQIQVQSVDGTKQAWYMPVKALCTSSCFAPYKAHQFAIGTITGMVYVYDTSKFEYVRLFTGHGLGVVGVAIHPNSEYVLSMSMDRMIRMWSMSLGQCVRVCETAGLVPTVLRFSWKGNWILHAAADGNIQIIDIATMSVIRQVKGNDAAIIAADLTADDRMIAAFDKNGWFYLWETKDETHTLHGHLASVRMDNIRILDMKCLEKDEIRLVGCV